MDKSAGPTGARVTGSTTQDSAETAVSQGDLILHEVSDYATSGSGLTYAPQCGSCTGIPPSLSCVAAGLDASTTLPFTATATQIVIEFTENPVPGCGEMVVVLTKQ